MRKYIFIALLSLLTIGMLACGKGDTEDTASQQSEVQPYIDPEDCMHDKHDPVTLHCLACDTEVDHYYRNGACTKCGKETEFLWEVIRRDTALMDILKSGGHEQKGTVERMTYDTFAYNIHALTGEEKTIEKEAYVYLPYGYDSSKQYDVVILQHGSGDTAGFWLAQGNYHPDDDTYHYTGNYTKELLDYLIGTGKAEPCIVITPTFYNDSKNMNAENGVLQPLYGHEVVEYLLPAVMEKYSTYAKTLDEVITYRDHFAYIGLSRGSRVSFDSILTYCLPYFAYVGSFSSPATDLDGLVSALNGDYRDYDIKYWYCAVGDQDFAKDRYRLIHETFDVLVSRVDRLEEGRNCAMVDVYEAGHTYECWLTCLCNALPKFFK